MKITKDMNGARILYYSNGSPWRTILEATILEVTDGGNVKFSNSNSNSWHTPKDLEPMELVEVIISKKDIEDFKKQNLCQKLGKSLADKLHEPIEIEQRDHDYIRPQFIMRNGEILDG